MCNSPLYFSLHPSQVGDKKREGDSNCDAQSIFVSHSECFWKLQPSLGEEGIIKAVSSPMPCM